MKSLLVKVLSHETLSHSEALDAMKHICSSEYPEQSVALLSALQLRGETISELRGFIDYLRQQITPIPCINNLVIDVCGTGGDHANTFNISTASAILLSAGGVYIAKHGGGRVSSQSGSSDVIQALQIPTMTDPSAASDCLRKTKFTFLTAATFNPYFEKIRSLRQRLGVRTCFNLLGPLLNPYPVRRQLIGVYHRDLLPKIAELLQSLSYEEVMVIHSQEGVDEFSLNKPTDVAHLKEGRIHYYQVNPAALGIQPAPLTAIEGKDPVQNAEIIENIFKGKRSSHRDVVLLNAAAGFVISGLASDFEAGIALGAKTIDEGSAHQKLIDLRQLNQER